MKKYCPSMLLSLPLCNNFGISFFYFFSLLSLTCYKKENESRCVQRCNKMVFPEHLILGRRECSVSPLSLSLLPFLDHSGIGNPEHFQIHVESERWLLSHQMFLQICGPAFPSQNHHRTGNSTIKKWIQAWLHFEHDSSNGLTTNKPLKCSFMLVSAGFCPCCFLKQYRRKLPQSGALKN